MTGALLVLLATLATCAAVSYVLRRRSTVLPPAAAPGAGRPRCGGSCTTHGTATAVPDHPEGTPRVNEIHRPDTSPAVREGQTRQFQRDGRNFKAYEAARAGATSLDVHLQAGEIKVHVGGVDRAQVLVSTTDESGRGHSAVMNTAITENGAVLRVHVPDIKGSFSMGGGSFQVNNFGGMHIDGDVIVTGGGNVTVNGRRLGGSSSGETIAPITVEIRLPDRSAVKSDSVSASLNVTGHAARVDAKSTSGDVVVASALEVCAQTTSGDVVAENTANAQITTMSGDIDVAGLTNGAGLSTMSGDIKIEARQECSINATSMSGDIRHSGSRVNASTMSGRIRQR